MRLSRPKEIKDLAECNATKVKIAAAEKREKYYSAEEQWHADFVLGRHAKHLISMPFVTITIGDFMEFCIPDLLLRRPEQLLVNSENQKISNSLLAATKFKEF